MPHLELRLLGTFQALLDGLPVTGFESGKVRALLAYLAVESDGPHTRDELAALLWPEQPDQTARTNLRQALANLRQAIGDQRAAPPFLIVARDSVQFNRESDYSLDVTLFTHQLDDCARHAHRHADRCRTCSVRMEQAVALYRGDLLLGMNVTDSAPFEEWATLKRESLHQHVLDALTRLAAYRELQGEYEQARRHAARQLALDPWREEAHRQTMRLLVRMGQRSAALDQYKRCRRILAGELGVEPAPETTRLYEEIRDGASEDDLSAVTAVARLPASLTPLVGRECEIAELIELVENPAHRLVTITGTGGIGKTRLALAVASELAHAFTHGTTFVSLAALSSVEFLLPTILAGLDVPLQGQVDPKVQLLTYLRDQEMLLILDNWEHLLPEGGGVELLAEMLQCAPGLMVLATSRERLGVQAEWLFDLQGLDCPKGASSAEIQDCSAIQLFMQRARQAQRRPALDQADLPAILRICQLVEGLPLAIELAAASVGERSCAQTAAEIEAGLGALTGRFRDAPERHRSVWATFEHSWNLLSEQERRTLRQVSVFRGGWQAESTAQVAEASLETLTVLVDKSLLRRNASGRFGMHELVRKYALDKLREVGEVENTHCRHLTFYLSLAQAAAPRLTHVDQVMWLARLDAEKDNLRAAMQWALDQPDAIRAMQLGEALRRFWQLRGHLIEGRQWLARTIEVARRHSAATKEYASALAKILNSAGELAFAQSDVAAARSFFDEGLSLFRELGDKQGIALSFNSLARIASSQGDKVSAWSLYLESLTLLRDLGDRYAVAWVLYNLGLLTANSPDAAQGIDLFQESMGLFRELGDRRGIAWSLKELAYAHQRQGGFEQAASMLEESLMLFREMEDKQGIAYVLNSLGEYWRYRGDMTQADACYSECLNIFRELGDKRGAAWLLANRAHVSRLRQDCARALDLFAEGLILAHQVGDHHSVASSLTGLAEVWGQLGQPLRAVRLFGAAEAMLTSIGERLDYADQASYQQSIAAVRARLGEAAFQAAWAEGCAMTLEQSIEYALSDEPDLSKTSEFRILVTGKT